MGGALGSQVPGQRPRLGTVPHDARSRSPSPRSSFRRPAPVQAGLTLNLIELITNHDAEGELRTVVHIIPPATAIDRHPLPRGFGSMVGALVRKRAMEGGR